MAEKELQKKGCGHITHPQIQLQLMSLVGWNDNMTVYVASIIVSNHNLQHLVCGWDKKARKYIQVQQRNQFHCYNQNMRFDDRKVAKYRIGIYK